MNTRRWILIASLLFPCAGHTAQLVDRVVAIVNNDVITEQELTQAIALFQMQVRAPTGNVRKLTLEKLIDDRLLKQSIDQANVAVSDEELAQAMQGFLQERGITETQLQGALAARGVAMGQFQQQLADQLKQMKFIQTTVGQNVHMSDAEMKNFYQRHRGDFAQAGRVRVAEILLTIPETADAKAQESVHKRARKLAAQARSKDFAEVARKHSSGPERAQGGDLGVIDPATLHRQVAHAIARLQVGDVSEPIRSARGYHILKVLDRGSAGNADFKRLQPQIQQALYQSKMQDALAQYLGKARTKAYIKIVE